MKAQQIQLVQDSFNLLSDETERVSALFYQRLFDINPSLRSLFSQDIAVQGAKFMRTLSMLVWGLHQSDRFTTLAHEVGQHHLAYGVRADYYQPVGEALLWALQQSLGEQFTPDVEDAWQAAYDLMSETMQSPPL